MKPTLTTKAFLILVSWATLKKKNWQNIFRPWFLFFCCLFDKLLSRIGYFWHENNSSSFVSWISKGLSKSWQALFFFSKPDETISLTKNINEYYVLFFRPIGVHPADVLLLNWQHATTKDTLRWKWFLLAQIRMRKLSTGNLGPKFFKFFREFWWDLFNWSHFVVFKISKVTNAKPPTFHTWRWRNFLDRRPKFFFKRFFFVSKVEDAILCFFKLLWRTAVDLSCFCRTRKEKRLSEECAVRGIPTLILFDENGDNMVRAGLRISSNPNSSLDEIFGSSN